MNRSEPTAPPVRGTVTSCTARGPRRYQEDRFVVSPVALGGGVPAHLLAVFDGHGGQEAAETCARGLLPALRQVATPDFAQSLQAAVGQLDRLTREFSAGTTLSVVLVFESLRRAVVAVLGDSPVIVVDRNGGVVVSPEHNARSNLEEREGAIRRGAYWDDAGYLRNGVTGYGLQLSRALGDAPLGSVLSRLPDVYCVELGSDSVVVLATDGVFDPAHDGKSDFAESVKRLRGATSPLSAHALIAWAKERGLQDNATAVVWETRFPHSYPTRPPR